AMYHSGREASPVPPIAAGRKWPKFSERKMPTTSRPPSINAGTYHDATIASAIASIAHGQARLTTASGELFVSSREINPASPSSAIPTGPLVSMARPSNTPAPIARARPPFPSSKPYTHHQAANSSSESSMSVSATVAREAKPYVPSRNASASHPAPSPANAAHQRIASTERITPAAQDMARALGSLMRAPPAPARARRSLATMAESQ